MLLRPPDHWSLSHHSLVCPHKVVTMRYEIICFIILLFQQAKTSTVNEQTCAAISNSTFHGDSCLTAVIDPKKYYADAKSSYNHFPNGHLAYGLTAKTREAIRQIIQGFGNWFAIGLEQVDTSVEPDGGWAWVHPDGTQWLVPDQGCCFGPPINQTMTMTMSILVTWLPQTNSTIHTQVQQPLKISPISRCLETMSLN